MSKTVIEVHNISKRYRIGLKEKKYETFAGQVLATLKSPLENLQRIRRMSRFGVEEDESIFWALKDINFEVKEGEVLGIIGHNGAGKSTLLKILSRVAEPTTGEVRIKGRIAALLEVGTGFHQELTGRENVYMNGTILGMTKREIDAKFDEIVDFSGVEKYIDTPVKFYSSGMKVRLAFAVAAHLEPEILIIDEVLAVGDADFQRKCLGKMHDVSTNDGRTVLFVSHNMAAIKTLCKNGLVLHNGALRFLGTQMSAISYYQNTQDINNSFEYKGDINRAPGNENIRILKFDVKSLAGEVISISSGFEFEIQFFNAREGINLDVTFELETIDNIAVFHHGTFVSDRKNSEIGIYVVRGIMPPNLLNAGTYSFSLIFGENQRYELYKVRSFIQFEILNETSGSNSSVLPGIIRPNITYSSYLLQDA